MPHSEITPDELRAAVLSGAEIAILDVRESEEFIGGHISVSANLPYGEIEIHVERLVPRRGVTVVVVDADGGELARRAGQRLQQVGYFVVRVLEGGIRTWQNSGYQLIEGVCSLGKTLGEFVKHKLETPSITAKELSNRFKSGKPTIVLDIRPTDEYLIGHIPGAVNSPGVEILRKAFGFPAPTDTLFVVNCTARTRSIIAAQTLIDNGFPHPVASLENGTTAWLIEGHDLEKGDGSRPHGIRLDDRGIRLPGLRCDATLPLASAIDKTTLNHYIADADERSLYLFDIRTAEEFQSGHLKGSSWVPGGQLIQDVQQHIVVRNARVVLLDSGDLIRARAVAAWLIRGGISSVEIYNLNKEEALAHGDNVATWGSETFGDLKFITTADLNSRFHDSDIQIIDLEPKFPNHVQRVYIPGSIRARRSTLRASLATVDPAKPIVLTSWDGSIAAYAQRDLTDAGYAGIATVDGGTRKWIEDGYPAECGAGQLVLPHTPRLEGALTLAERAKRLDEYVKWGEHILVQSIKDGMVQFNLSVELASRKPTVPRDE